MSAFALSPAGEALLAEAERIGRDVARPAADDVDRDARFPHEAFAAIAEAGLLASLVPVDKGGPGCTWADVAAQCLALGQHCGSTGLIFAMHQIQVACLVRHGTTPFFEESLRTLVTAPRLMGSATTEVGIGGDVRSSITHVDVEGDTFYLDKEAGVISYGDQADDILVTARRTPDSPPSDQAICLVRRPDVTLEAVTPWDTLGMRGTCSIGYRLKSHGSVDQIVPEPYAVVSAQTMLPVTHLFWSSVWLGIATDAVSIARAHVRTAARKTPGVVPASAPRLAELHASLESLRATVAGAADAFTAIADDRAAVAATASTLRWNALKVAASEAVVDIVAAALRIVGIAGYRNDSPSSLGRHLRDAHSAALMVHNDRILANSGALLCVYKEA